MTRNLHSVALPRGRAALISARLAERGVSLKPRTINSALNFVRGGRSGQPLRDHMLARAFVEDPDIRALGLVVNDVLDPPIPPDTPIWAFDDDDRIAERKALAEQTEAA